MNEYHKERNKWRNREILIDVSIRIVCIAFFIFIIFFAIFK
jgi:hypothetical protein